MIANNPVTGRYLRLVSLAAGLSILAACSNPVTKAVGGIFDGNSEKKAAEEQEEKDERISILALDEAIEADPRFAGTLIEIPPSYRNVSWPQPGGEADHTLHHLSAAVTLEKAWNADIDAESGRRARLTSPPVAADGSIYVIDAEARVSSFSMENGERIWRTELTPEVKERFRVREIFSGNDPAQIGFGGGVAYDGGRIFITSGFGFAAALNAETGEEIWRTKTDAPVRTAPTAYRGNVYFVTNTNEMVALNQSDGSRNWNFQSFEEAARILSSASPAAAGDLVVAPFSSGELIAFLSDSGRSVWNDTQYPPYGTFNAQRYCRSACYRPRSRLCCQPRRPSRGDRYPHRQSRVGSANCEPADALGRGRLHICCIGRWRARLSVPFRRRGGLG